MAFAIMYGVWKLVTLRGVKSCGLKIMNSQDLQSPLRDAYASPVISILMYHQVGEFGSPKECRSVLCNVKRFAGQMHYLRLAGYEVLSLREAREMLFEGRPVRRRSVVLTFDDGCDNFREYAWPILKRYGYPATVFVMPDMLGGRASWMRPPYDQGRLMTAGDLAAMQAEGLNIGSHTLTHCRLAECSLEQMNDEIVGSRHKLEDRFQTKVEDLCYPYGSYNQKVVEAAQEAGYRTGLTCRRAHGNLSPNPFEITRKAISHGDSILGMAFKLLKPR
jgi:peptidoglycan/xylan/chitin deacetylase (PgdA/CDA1 family)